MRGRLALWVIALTVLGNAGCGLVSNSTAMFSSRMHECLDDIREEHRNAKWAEQAWEQARSASPGQPFSVDHERGFKAGFIGFVARGNGEPPPLPPADYRSIQYQTPRGYQAIEEWFAGYRHGVALAQHGGYRDLVTGPSSLRSSVPPALAVSMPAAPGGAPSESAVPPRPPARLPAPANEELPPPTPLPASPAARPAQTRISTVGTPEPARERRVLFSLTIDCDPPWK